MPFGAYITNLMLFNDLGHAIKAPKKAKDIVDVMKWALTERPAAVIDG
jgi:hypothetical protein